jgi:hypothetical protein
LAKCFHLASTCKQLAILCFPRMSLPTLEEALDQGTLTDSLWD